MSGILARLRRFYKRITTPPHKKRTVLVAELKHEPYEDGWQWADIYQVWLCGIGDDTIEYRRERVDTALVDPDNGHDGVVDVPLVREGFDE